MRVAPVDVEAELARLPRRRLAELGAAVARVHAEESRQAVQIALAALVEDVAALAAHDDRHVVLRVRAHAREVHPEVPFGQLLEPAVRALLGAGELELRGHRAQFTLLPRG